MAIFARIKINYIHKLDMLTKYLPVLTQSDLGYLTKKNCIFVN